MCVCYSFVDLKIEWLLLKLDRMRFYVNVCHKFMSTASKAHTQRMDIIRNGHHDTYSLGLFVRLVSNGHLNWFYSIDNSVADLFNQKLLSLSVYYDMATAHMSMLIIR